MVQDAREVEDGDVAHFEAVGREDALARRLGLAAGARLHDVEEVEELVHAEVLVVGAAGGAVRLDLLDEQHDVGAVAHQLAHQLLMLLEVDEALALHQLLEPLLGHVAVHLAQQEGDLLDAGEVVAVDVGPFPLLKDVVLVLVRLVSDL